MTGPTTTHRGLRHLRPGVALGLLLGAAVAVGACGADTTANEAAFRAGTGGGYAGGTGGGYGGGYGGGEDASGDVVDRLADHPHVTLTQAEIDGLVHMREEEKLAHDVYVALGEAWGNRVFENIARSETLHTEAVRVLLDRYGIPDPAAGMAQGSFTDPELQALHDQLVARGRTSLAEALTVGALIEDLDIADLRERATATPDLALVYGDLESGSENHLRAFTRNLARQGTTYTPTYLAQDEYDRIVTSTSTSGLSS